jgi:hypothetical protein
MKLLSGLLLGSLTGVLVVSIVGALFGGYTRMAPCGTATPFEGAILGIMYFEYMFGLPVAIAGGLLGTVIAWCLKKLHAHSNPHRVYRDPRT